MEYNESEIKFTFDFLEKWTGRSIPSVSHCRSKEVDRIYDEAVQKLREKIGENLIWISIDETTDSDGRSIGVYMSFTLFSNSLENFDAKTVSHRKCHGRYIEW